MTITPIYTVRDREGQSHDIAADSFSVQAEGVMFLAGSDRVAFVPAPLSVIRNVAAAAPSAKVVPIGRIGEVNA